jgi:hypothetical protein
VPTNESPTELPNEDSTVPAQLRVAVALIGLEALGMVALALVLLVKSVTGHPHSLVGALLGVLMALLGAAVLALCARGLARLSPAARSPIIVLEVIALPVIYDLAFQAGLVGIGAPILVVALAVLYLIFTPPVREVLDRDN